MAWVVKVQRVLRPYAGVFIVGGFDSKESADEWAKKVNHMPLIAYSQLLWDPDADSLQAALDAFSHPYSVPIR